MEENVSHIMHGCIKKVRSNNKKAVLNKENVEKSNAKFMLCNGSYRNVQENRKSILST